MPSLVRARAHRPLALAVVIGIAGSSCARFQHYAPAPLDPARAPRAFVGRRLADSAVASFLAAQSAPRRDTLWTPRQLALAAVLLHPALREGATDVETARAAELTAGTPPEVTASAEVTRAARADEGKSSPWSVALTSGLTLETAGKRGARRARARAATLAAELRLEAMGWDVGTAAERAAVRAIGAEQELADWSAERDALADVAALVRGRFAEGTVSLADLAQAEQEARSAALSVAQAGRARTGARLDLARSLALSLRAVDSLPLGSGDLATECASPGAASFDSAGAAALRQRFDVGAALAGYAVAEADLRIEVARQYPDLTIGPGIGWDQGVGQWILSAATPGILRRRNRGPIAEARARRSREAARVASLQDSVLIAADSAVATCRDAPTELVAAAAVATSAERALALANAAYQRGETGRTEVAFARLASLRARHAQRAALQRALEAAAALETARGAWPDSAPRWPTLRALLDTTRPPTAP